jgi:hypothetical protein
VAPLFHPAGGCEEPTRVSALTSGGDRSWEQRCSDLVSSSMMPSRSGSVRSRWPSASAERAPARTAVSRIDVDGGNVSDAAETTTGQRLVVTVILE